MSRRPSQPTIVDRAHPLAWIGPKAKPRLTSYVQMSIRRGQVARALLAIAPLVALTGCGTSAKTSSQGSSRSSVPAYVSEPFTAQQQLIEQGAHLVVSDGCSACHLNATARNIAPSFASFAGHPLRLTNGRRVIVNERFLREALLHPSTPPVKGYNAAPMLLATKRLNLAKHPRQVAALAAFIEQIGPEPG
jgi:hypothetical protein